MSAPCPGRRNSRGRGLPGCDPGVTPPISTKPKPSRNSGATATASLSNPAAIPIGLEKSRPQTLVCKTGSSAADRRGARPPLSANKVSRCAVSGGKACRIGRTIENKSGDNGASLRSKNRRGSGSFRWVLAACDVPVTVGFHRGPGNPFRPRSRNMQDRRKIEWQFANNNAVFWQIFINPNQKQFDIIKYITSDFQQIIQSFLSKLS